MTTRTAKCPLINQSEGKELPLTSDVVCNADAPFKTIGGEGNANFEHFTGGKRCSCVEFDLFSNTRGLKEQSWRHIRPTASCKHERYGSSVI